jgi:hypothetical protein
MRSGQVLRTCIINAESRVPQLGKIGNPPDLAVQVGGILLIVALPLLCFLLVTFGLLPKLFLLQFNGYACRLPLVFISSLKRASHQ